METRNIKDFLHLYLGCEVENYPYKKYEGIETQPKRMIGLLVGVIGEYAHIQNKDVFGKDWDIIKEPIADVKPLLRPLSSMTEEEAIELVKLSEWESYGDHPHIRNYKTYKNNFDHLVVSWGEGLREKNIPENKKVFAPNEFQFLLSKHFDLFNLIESGLAIDKTKI